MEVLFVVRTFCTWCCATLSVFDCQNPQVTQIPPNPRWPPPGKICIRGWAKLFFFNCPKCKSGEKIHGCRREPHWGVWHVIHYSSLWFPCIFKACSWPTLPNSASIWSLGWTNMSYPCSGESPQVRLDSPPGCPTLICCSTIHNQ